MPAVAILCAIGVSVRAQAPFDVGTASPPAAVQATTSMGPTAQQAAEFIERAWDYCTLGPAKDVSAKDGRLQYTDGFGSATVDLRGMKASGGSHSLRLTCAIPGCILVEDMVRDIKVRIVKSSLYSTCGFGKDQEPGMVDRLRKALTSYIDTLPKVAVEPLTTAESAARYIAQAVPTCGYPVYTKEAASVADGVLQTSAQGDVFRFPLAGAKMSRQKSDSRIEGDIIVLQCAVPGCYQTYYSWDLEKEQGDKATAAARLPRKPSARDSRLLLQCESQELSDKLRSALQLYMKSLPVPKNPF